MSKRHASPSFSRCAQIVCVAFFVVAAVPFAPAAAPQASADADGTLDSTFGVEGKLRIDFSGQYDTLSTLALLPDGKLIVAGKIYSTSSNEPEDEPLVLMRYNADGTLDTTFGDGGKFVGLVGKMRYFGTIVPLPDGKILLGGGAYDRGADYGMARFNGDGTLDTTFGSNGTVVTDAGAADYASALLIQPDGKILLAGDGGRPNRQASAFIVARYDAFGNLDQSFGERGLASVTFSKGFDFVGGAALQPDGKIVLAGLRDVNADDTTFALARFNGDGSLDATFGGGGKVTTDFAGQDCEAFAIALQPDGKIIAAGNTRQAGSSREILAMARYNADGSLDTSFGAGGKVTHSLFGRGGEAHALALQRDGKIVVGGIAGFLRAGNPDVDYAVLRYNKDGSLDTSFDGDGIAITDCADVIDNAHALAIQADGRIILGGTSTDEYTRADMVIVRYHSTSSPFDNCIRDDATGDLLQFNSATGDYQFTVCATGLTLSGKGTVSVKGCKTKLQAAASDHRLALTVKTCKGKASATIERSPTGQTFAIIDSNLADSACTCH